MAEWLYPEEGYHSTILGTTGSGKSTYGMYLMSRAPFHLRPQFLLDYKHEDIIAQLTRVREIGVNETLPKQPGLYVIRPRPDQNDDVENFFERLWNNGNAGLYVDEAYLTPDKKWLRNLCVTGRSLRITITACSQRPVDVPRFFFTEAAYITCFRLNDDDDKKSVARFTPKGMLERRLPDYHSFWYSPKHHRADDQFPYVILKPVPGVAEIVDLIDSRLRPRHTLI